LTRREALRLLGIGGAALLAATVAPRGNGLRLSTNQAEVRTALDCVVRPELTIGPYFVDDQLNRSDIRYDPLEANISKGTPLILNLRVMDTGDRCTPLEGARVDVWHCDALGIYSGVTERVFNTRGQQFLRGYQISDEDGLVHFQTIYPGWYSGRAVHIHFTVRTRARNGRDYQFTSQLFFRDAITDQVHSQKPYKKKGERDTRNRDDSIFRMGGNRLLLDVRGDGAGGYIASINIGLDLTDAEAGAADSF
jgi:protocatechuate 3,4-dioxygenase beta subunit